VLVLGAHGPRKLTVFLVGGEGVGKLLVKGDW
jgi:hypothetical protein